MATCHNLIVPSLEPEAKVLLSGEKAILLTRATCRPSMATSNFSHVSEFHIMILPSYPAVDAILPSGENAMVSTVPV